MLFKNLLDKSNCRIAKSKGRTPNKIWVDKSSEFYNRSVKSWLEKNDTEMYSVHDERKSVVFERFIRVLKNKIYKYMSSISQNVYIDKLDDIVYKYIIIHNNTYHSTIKIRPVDVKLSTVLTLVKKLMMKILNLKLMILLVYQNITTFLQKTMFQISLNSKFRGHMLLAIFKAKKLLERFTKKNCKKQIRNSLELRK